MKRLLFDTQKGEWQNIKKILLSRYNNIMSIPETIDNRKVN